MKTYLLATPIFFFSSHVAWANPSPRLHQARLQMDNSTNPPKSTNPVSHGNESAKPQKGFGQ